MSAVEGSEQDLQALAQRRYDGAASSGTICREAVALFLADRVFANLTA